MTGVPERAVFPLMPALTLGFILGVIAAALKLDDGGQLTLGIVGAVVTLVMGGVSVISSGGLRSEQLIVGVLRAIGAAVLFGTTYLAILALISDGEPVRFLLWALLAAVVGITLARVRVRGDREHPPAETEQAAGT